MADYNKDAPPEDDWTAPESMWQVLQKGGYVHNLTEEEYSLMMATTNNLDPQHKVYFGNDIYGDEVCFVLEGIVCIKHWTKLGGERYKKFHADDDRSY